MSYFPKNAKYSINSFEMITYNFNLHLLAGLFFLINLLNTLVELENVVPNQISHCPFGSEVEILFISNHKICELSKLSNNLNFQTCHFVLILKMCTLFKLTKFQEYKYNFFFKFMFLPQ